MSGRYDLITSKLPTRRTAESFSRAGGEICLGLTDRTIVKNLDVIPFASTEALRFVSSCKSRDVQSSEGSELFVFRNFQSRNKRCVSEYVCFVFYVSTPYICTVAKTMVRS